MISFKQFFKEATLHTGDGSLSYWISTNGDIISGKDSGKIGDDVEHWDILQSHFPLVFAMDTDIAEQERFLNENGYFSLSMFRNEGIFIRALHGIDFPSELVEKLELVLAKIDPRLEVVVQRR